MRSTTLAKALGLAALGVVAAMAFVGTTSAFAEVHEHIGLCSAEELELCTAEHIIPRSSGTLLAFQEGTGVFIGGAFTQECSGGMGKGEITSEEMSELNNLTGKLTSLTFTGCEPCSTVTVTTPVNVHLSMSGEQWTLESSENGHAEFSGCPFGATCVFGGKHITSLVEMNGSESVLNTNGTELEFQGGTGGEFLCGSSGEWFAKFGLRWTLKADGKEDPVWLTLLL